MIWYISDTKGLHHKPTSFVSLLSKLDSCDTYNKQHCLNSSFWLPHHPLLYFHFAHCLQIKKTNNKLLSSCVFRCPVSISVTTMDSKNCFNFGSMDLHQYCSSNCIGKSIKPTLVLIIKVAYFFSLHTNCVFTCS